MNDSWDESLVSTWKTLSAMFTYTFSFNTETRGLAASQLSPQLLWTTQMGAAGGLTGFMAGTYMTGNTRSLQVLAENAHRLPRTRGGWMQYHRYRQFEVIHAAIPGGLKGASKFAGLMAGYALLEQQAERVWDCECWTHSVMGGLSLSLVFSAWNRLSLHQTGRAMGWATLASLAMGLVQDGYAHVAGASLKYPRRQRNDGIWPWIPPHSLQ